MKNGWMLQLCNYFLMNGSPNRVQKRYMKRAAGFYQLFEGVKDRRYLGLCDDFIAIAIEKK